LSHELRLSELGHGSHGTVVYKGSFQGDPVAVKKCLAREHDTLAEREDRLLKHADDHPNVIRYLYQETRDNFQYIVLALCPASLANFIGRPDEFREIADSFDPKDALREITSGLEHLHSLDIVHRGINPENILILNAKEGKSDRYRMVISGFGLCQKLEAGQATASSADSGGTPGWRAPEILRWKFGATALKKIQTMQLTKSVDIFPLGCLYYYCLTSGGHPFGDDLRECNILQDQKSLQDLEGLREDGPEAVDLITSMLAPEAFNRCVC